MNAYGWYNCCGYYYPYPSYLYHNQSFFYNNAYLNSISQAVRGSATWTNGGTPTKCGIPWSINNYMTVAVSPNSPYKCGQSLRVTNLSISPPKEIVVTVVDTVEGFPPNKINLHRNAFEALGSPARIGLINVGITPVKQQVEYAKWGRLLLNLTKEAFPAYNIIDYQFVGSERLSDNQIREVFEFILQSNSEKINIRATVVFNPNTEKIQSITFVSKTSNFLSKYISDTTYL